MEDFTGPLATSQVLNAKISPVGGLTLQYHMGNKSLNGDAPSHMSDMFTKVNVSTTRSLRNSDYDLRVPFLRTTTEMFLLPGCETLEWFI